jgi:hypothetical protein
MREFALALLPFASEASREYWSVELTSLEEGAARAAHLPIGRPPAQRQEPTSFAAGNGRTGSDLVAFDLATPNPRAGLTGDRPARDSLQPQIGVAIPRPRKQRSLFWVGAAAGTALGLAGAWVTGHSTARPHGAVASASAGSDTSARTAPAAVLSEYEVDVHVVPATAAVILDGEQVAIGHYRARLPRDGKLHELRAKADGFITRSHNFRDAAPPRDIQLMPSGLAASAPSERELAVLSEARRGASSRASSTTPRARSGARVPVREVARRLEPEAHIGVIASERPRVRIVDEFEPHVRIIE